MIELRGQFLVLLVGFALAGCLGSNDSGVASAPQDSAGNTQSSPALASEPLLPPQPFAVESVTPDGATLHVTWTGSMNAATYTVSAARRAGGVVVAQDTATSLSAMLSGMNVGFAHTVTVRASNAAGSISVSYPIAATPIYGAANPANQYLCMRSFYVSPAGSDGNDGVTPERAFRSINRATGQSDLRGGDCINLLPGEYIETVDMARGGSADGGFVVLRSSIPWAARVVAPTGSYSVIRLDANYLVVDGLDVYGGDGNGIDGCLRRDRVRQHLRVLNNRVHRAGLSGIGLCWGDHYRVEGNVVHDNSWTNGWQGSGISIYGARSAGGIESGPRMLVRNNIAYNNIVKLACNRCHTDGNGIIIDDFRGTQEEAASPWKNVVYPHATLVENNLVFGNGGKGIHVFLSDFVTVRNNTAYHNNQDKNFDGTWRSELSNAMSSQNTWINNIAVTDPAVDQLNRAIADFGSGGPNVGVLFRNNLAWAGGSVEALVINDGSNSPITSAGGNLIGVDPRFIRPSLDPLEADFRLAGGSPGFGAGATDTPFDNLNGIRRGSRMDIGAY